MKKQRSSSHEKTGLLKMDKIHENLSSLVTSHDVHEDHGGVHVASWDFDYVKEPLVLASFVLALTVISLS